MSGGGGGLFVCFLFFFFPFCVSVSGFVYLNFFVLFCFCLFVCCLYASPGFLRCYGTSVPHDDLILSALDIL